MSRTPLNGLPHKDKILILKNYNGKTAEVLAYERGHIKLSNYLKDMGQEIYGKRIFENIISNSYDNRNNNNNNININVHRNNNDNISNKSNLKNENKLKDFHKIPIENCDEKNQKKKTVEKVDIRDEKEIEENILNCNKSTRLIGVYGSEEKNEKTQITDIEKILSKKINCEAVEDENLKRKSKNFSFSSTKKRNKKKGGEKKKKEVVSFGCQNEEILKQNICTESKEEVDGREEGREEAVFDDEADYEEYSFALAPQARSAVGYYNIQNNNIESTDDKDDINNDDDNNNNDDNNNKNNNSHDHDNNSQIDNNNIDSHENLIT